jgi:hypothetical protein
MAAHTALLVVHGIGAQQPGETVDKLARGLRLVDPAFTLTSVSGGMAATIGGQPLRLYEVYWADLLEGEKMRGAFLMNELQSLSWFPWFNLRRGNYRPLRYSFLKLTFWCVVLPVVNFFVLFTYYGVQLFAQIWTGATGTSQHVTSARFASRVQEAARRTTSPTAFDRVLDEYVGDVLTYVNSAGQAFYREKDEPPVAPELQDVCPRIVQRFHEQLVQAHLDGCASIHVVAHSLGTVVAYHALSGFGGNPSAINVDGLRAAQAKVTRVYTIGSPLEKIRFFWPRLAPAARPRHEMTLRWDNFVSFFDPVSGMLRTFDDWGPVNNHRLLGGGFVMGHVVYEHSAVFLGALTEGLCGSRLRLKQSLGARLRGLLVLAGETLFAPAVLGIAIGAGAGLFMVTAAFVPFLLSWMVRWFVPPETWAPVVDTATVVLLGMMVLVFLVAPAARAGKVHLRHWVVDDARARSPRQMTHAD